MPKPNFLKFHLYIASYLTGVTFILKHCLSGPIPLILNLEPRQEFEKAGKLSAYKNNNDIYCPTVIMPE